jgi:hypothetical protein
MYNKGNEVYTRVSGRAACIMRLLGRLYRNGLVRQYLGVKSKLDGEMNGPGLRCLGSWCLFLCFRISGFDTGVGHVKRILPQV